MVYEPELVRALRAVGQKEKDSWRAGPPLSTLAGTVHLHLKGGSKFASTRGPLVAHLELVQANASDQVARSRAEEDGGANPVWDEHFVFPIHFNLYRDGIENPFVRVNVSDVQAGVCIGSAHIPLFNHVCLEGHTFEATVPLSAQLQASACKTGQVLLSAQIILDDYDALTKGIAGVGSALDKEQSGSRRVCLQALRAANVDYSDYKWAGQIEPVLRLKAPDGQLFSTVSAPSFEKSNPRWGDCFDLSDAKDGPIDLEVELLNDNSISENALVATGRLSVDGKAAVFERGAPNLSCALFSARNSSKQVGTAEFSLLGTGQEDDTKQSAMYYKIHVQSGTKLRAPWGRIHRAIVQLEQRKGAGAPNTVLARTEAGTDSIKSWAQKTRRVGEAGGESSSGGGKKLFQWGCEFNLDYDLVGALSEQCPLEACVYDVSNPDDPKHIGSVSLQGESNLSWVEITPVEPLEKSAGSLELGVMLLPHRQGILTVSVEHLDQDIPLRKLLTVDTEDSPEFIRVRVEPEGRSYRSEANKLSQPLQVTFDTQTKKTPAWGAQSGAVQDKLFVSLLVDDPTIAANAICCAIVDVGSILHNQSLAKSVSQRVLANLCNPVSLRPLGTGATMTLKLGFKPSATAADRPVAPPQQQQSETGRAENPEASVEKCIAVSRLKKMFYQIDLDGSGAIDIDEFSQALAKQPELLDALGGSFVKGGAKKLFERIDVNHDNSLTWSEFRDFATTQSEQVSSRATSSIAEMSESKEGEDDGLFGDQGGDECLAPAEEDSEQGEREEEESKAIVPQRPPRQQSGAAKGKRKFPKSPKSRRRRIKTTYAGGRLNGTSEKYDETQASREILDDPVELRRQVNSAQKKTKALEDANRKLKVWVSKLSNQRRREFPPLEEILASVGPEDGETSTQRMDDFESQEDGDQALPQDHETALVTDSGTGDQDELKTRVRELEHAMQIKEDLHQRELAAKQEEALRLKEELQDAVERHEQAEEAKSRQREQLNNEKQKRSQLETSVFELDSELNSVRRTDKNGLSSTARRLLWLKAQEAEHDERLEHVYRRRAVEQRAAERLQALVRGARARRTTNVEKGVRLRAAIRLQSVARRMVARKRFAQDKGQAEEASRRIQSAFRGKRERDSLRAQQAAAERIQCSFRGDRARKQARRASAERASAVRIQALLRRRGSIKRAETLRDSRDKEIRAAVAVQGVVRRALARQRTAVIRERKEQEQVEHNAARMIQNRVRSHKSAKVVEQAREEHARRTDAALCVQRNVRRRNSIKAEQEAALFADSQTGDQSMPGQDGAVAEEEDKDRVADGFAFDPKTAREILHDFVGKTNERLGLSLATEEKAKQTLSTALIDMEERVPASSPCSDEHTNVLKRMRALLA